MMIGRSLFLAALVILSACQDSVDPESCHDVPLAERPDTVVRFSVDGRKVVYGTGDQVLLELDTLGDQFTLLAVRSEGPSSGDRTIRLGVSGFAGPGVYPMLGAGETTGVAFARYWCPTMAGGERMYVAAGIGGDVVDIDSFDAASGLVVGLFRFHAEPFHGSGDGPIVTQGYFRGTVTRVGDAGMGDVTDRP